MMEFTTKRKRTSMQLAADGFAAVVEKLGMADAIRYVQLFNNGEGNYSRDRHAWLDQISDEQAGEFLKRASRKMSGRKRGARS
jgi:hypothetical protein